MQSKEVKSLIENLEKWRINRKISQADFAKSISLSPSSYCKLVSGFTNTITADTVKAIYETTGYLCFQLMEYCPDDDLYLKLGYIAKEMSDKELMFMIRIALEIKEMRAYGS